MGFFADLFGVSPRSISGKLVKLANLSDMFERRLRHISESASPILSGGEHDMMELLYKEIRTVLPQINAELVRVDKLEKIAANPNLNIVSKNETLGKIDIHVNTALALTAKLTSFSDNLVKLAEAVDRDVQRKKYFNEGEKQKSERMAARFLEEAHNFNNELHTEVKLEKKLRKEETKR
ncbi:MAG: hypothetical protein PHC66_04515 [Candidatus Nanoarchaeia archaeon]|nr:hypothetical protein [Candidatus Nanoarchaeia archaeon]MDD5239778.1 hypothetical protein [Candidatus Nanoarchaeia archaeon]